MLLRRALAEASAGRRVRRWPFGGRKWGATTGRRRAAGAPGALSVPELRRARRRERRRLLRGLPPAALLGLGVWTLLLAGGVLIGAQEAGLLRWADLLTLAEAPPADWPTLAAALGAGFADAWLGLGVFGAPAWLLWPLAALWLWVQGLNLALPSALHLRFWQERRLRAVLVNNLFSFLSSKQDDGHQPGPLARLAAHLERRARRRWLRRRLFGRRHAFAAPPDLALLMLRDMDGLADEDIPWLQALAALKRPRQGLLLVSQSADTSSLEGCYIKVWEAAGPAPERLWMVQEPQSVHIPPAPLIEAPGTGFALHIGADGNLLPSPTPAPVTRCPDPARRAQAALRLAELLGLLAPDALARLRPPPDAAPPTAPPSSRDERARDQDRDALGKALERLGAHGYDPLQLLAALVLGSAPAAPMELHQPLGLAHLSDLWEQELSPYHALLCTGRRDLPPVLDDMAQDALLRHAMDADALLLEKQGDVPVDGRWTQWRRLVGRAGYRLHLAQALRDYAGDTAAADLPRLIACGELHHLRCACDLLEGASPPWATRRNAGHLAPLLKAALFLLRERLSLAASQPPHPLLVDAWRRLHARLTSPSVMALADDHGHAWVLYLAALGLVEASGADVQAFGFPQRLDACLAELDEALDAAEDPDDRAACQQDARARFQAAARALQHRIDALEPDLGRLLLETRLRRDWFPLPERIKARLRQRCLDQAGTRLIGALARACRAGEPAAAILAVAEHHRQRPLLVLGGLAWLALAQVRSQADGAKDAGPSSDTALLRIADFLEAMRVRHGGENEPIPALLPPPSFQPAQTAPLLALLEERDFRERLHQLSERGAAERTALQRGRHQLGLDEAGAEAPEGIALGSRDAVHRVIEGLSERLLGASG